ncbi:MAG: methylenetetrahydrofolate--tRNA-(uracil(54)-C(5))-methyltransferase (FADH(2)-oxidizing) TrmFO [Gemmatimonadaceae bacterium]|jgi:methylenetetrahydrofolate--tRNA-(uracil-5-)-methyltransferase|nr:methylenetetrahydrofolate--tRNA-(uracil(54)-C(5))-methyltransferase (FADH(2)-oxidizing) TrmFO [Gemmatimonadaceae bacterium]
MKATIIGGGLAGCEAALALADRGVDVTLVEMRPVVKTAAHQSDRLGELVCSNSFKSVELQNAHGLLKQELRDLGSQLLPCADEARVPGGAALAVDREVFSQLVDARVKATSRITVVREEATALPEVGIVATGPLTSDALATAISTRLGTGALAFFDAIAPIVSHDSLDHSQLYALSRWGKGDGDDYLNAPMDKAMYEAFIDALVAGDQFQGHAFDDVPYFEGCLPVEEMAKRGRETLRFGPMKPIGLHDPRTNREPYAVVQFRREDKAGQMWNLVGFQTRLRIPEQQKVFRAIPGMAEAEFLRYGSIHRNSYINAPATLGPALQVKDGAALFFAGQLTGVEGYTESLATGMLAGINLARVLHGDAPVVPPPTTMLGGLLRYLREAEPAHFQPMNANFGLLDPIEGRATKVERKARAVERARQDFAAWRSTL